MIVLWMARTCDLRSAICASKPTIGCFAAAIAESACSCSLFLYCTIKCNYKIFCLEQKERIVEFEIIKKIESELLTLPGLTCSSTSYPSLVFDFLTLVR